MFYSIIRFYNQSNLLDQWVAPWSIEWRFWKNWPPSKGDCLWSWKKVCETCKDNKLKDEDNEEIGFDMDKEESWMTETSRSGCNQEREETATPVTKKSVKEIGISKRLMGQGVKILHGELNKLEA